MYDCLWFAWILFSIFVLVLVLVTCGRLLCLFDFLFWVCFWLHILVFVCSVCL